MRSYRGLALGWLLVLTLLHLWMIGSGRWPLSGGRGALLGMVAAPRLELLQQGADGGLPDRR